MTETCRAAVFAGDGTYEVREFAVPTAPAGGGVLKVEAVGLCASDVAQLHGHRHVPGEVSPVVPGHEIVGRVHQLADDADLAAAVGDRVGVDLVVRCGTCRGCSTPHGVCSQMHVYGYTQGLDVRSGLHGGYAEFIEILPGTHLVPLPDDVPAAELSLFEPLANVVNWIDRLGPGADETVVVQGPGHMGLICAAYLRMIGVGTLVVTGTSRDELRLEAAGVLGADHVVDVEKTDLVAEIGRLTDGRMADVTIDLTDAGPPVGACLELTAAGGRILWAGLKNFEPVSVVSDLVPLKSLSIIGGAGSTAASMAKTGEVLRSGRYPTADLQGAVFTLDSINEAMGMLTRADPAQDAVRVSLTHTT